MTTTTELTSRDQAIQTIKAALKARSGQTWSVTGGRGTAWGWITITTPPSRRVDFGYLTTEDAAKLGELLGLGHPAHQQGVSIAASSSHYAEYIARAQGQTPAVIAQPYWD